MQPAISSTCTDSNTTCSPSPDISVDLGSSTPLQGICEV